MNRRQFVERVATAAGAIAIGGPLAAEPRQRARKLSDRTALGKTGIKVSVLGLGTGTVGGGQQSNQTRAGQDNFTRMVRTALDGGVTLFDCADQYGTHSYLREALRGVARGRYVLQTKTNSRTREGVLADVDRFRVELGVDRIDTVLLHCVMEADWNTRYRGAMDALSEARQKGWIRAHGCSCHTLEALTTAAAEPWVQVDLARFNPWGRIMDAGGPTAPQTVKALLAQMKQAGKGVIGMKILAEGRMVRGADRIDRIRESVRFALASGVLDTMVIGFETPQQVTEVPGEMRLALQEIARPAA